MIPLVLEEGAHDQNLRENSVPESVSGTQDVVALFFGVLRSPGVSR
jgi:hypothetical protein